MRNRLYSFFLLYLSVLLPFTILTPIQATNDAQGPIMESISIEKEVYTKGETIVITVVASDESGIKENTLLAQFNSGGTSKDRVFYFEHVEGNTYIGKLTVDENWVNGTYHLGLLSGKDIYGNWGHKGNLAASFQIVGCRSDCKAPIIDSLTTDKTTYGVGETITLTMVAHDDSEIDVNSMSSMFNITGSSGDHTFYFEEVAENTYEGKLVVGESWQKGTYHMALTYIADIYGNWNTRHEIETSFVVNSEIKDLEGPKILSLIADKEEYSIGDTIELTLRAEDKSGISEADMAAQFNVYGLNKDRIFTFNKVDEGVYKASAITDDTWLVGTYSLGWLSVLDIYHNRANTIDVETSFVLKDKEIEEYPVERIEFNTDELSLLVGEEAQMEVVFFPTNASNQELIWESSNREIVEVENGKVKAISSGEVIVKAISYNGKEAICKIVVKEEKKPSLRIEPKEAILMTVETSKYKRSIQLNAILYPDIEKIHWKSSNPACAMVDEKGLVTAIADTHYLGTVVTITAYTDSGLSAQTIIRVENPINAFVRRAYDLLLDRRPDRLGFSFWKKRLEDQLETGTSMLYGFFTSDEMRNKEIGDEVFVELCYRAILGQDKDEEGKAYWIGKLKEGSSRKSVLKGFVDSEEYRQICNEYNLIAGTIEDSSIKSFIQKCYRNILGRNSEQEGIEYWSNYIEHAQDKERAYKDMLIGFFQSEEFLKKKMNGEDYISLCYKIILDRDVEEEGLIYWGNRLLKEKKEDILKAIVESNEGRKKIDRMIYE